MKTQVIFLVLLILVCGSVLADINIKKWSPLDPDDLAMTDHPTEPGAAAMILFKHAELGDGTYVEHGAIKIFTDAGREQANIDLRFSDVTIKARTVNPDGSIIEISKKDIHKKIVFKNRYGRIKSYVFSYPEAGIGSILEYKIKRDLTVIDYLLFIWPFQTELYCREAVLSIRPGFIRAFNRQVMDPYRQVKTITREQVDGWERIKATDVPALPEEDFGPPGYEGMSYFLAYLALQNIKGGDACDLTTAAGRAQYVKLFWEQFGEKTAKNLNTSLKPEKALGKYVQTILNDDTSASSDRKIYDHIQSRFQNTSFETRSEEIRNEEKKKKRKKERAFSLKRMIKEQSGSSEDLMLLCVAMLREVGYPAYPAYACGREEVIFHKDLLYDQFMKPLVVIVNQDEDRTTWLEPSTPYCLFGELAWYNQGVQAMIFYEDRGEFAVTPISTPEQNHVTSIVELVDLEDGVRVTLNATLTGCYNPMLKNDLDDDTNEERRAYVESILKECIEGCKLDNYDIINLRDPLMPLEIRAEYTLSDHAVHSGTMIMLKPAILGKHQTRYFTETRREYPIFFDFPFTITEEYRIKIPDGAMLSELPDPISFANKIGRYTLNFEKTVESVICRREFVREGIGYINTHYPSIRALYEAARKGDEATLIFSKADGK